MPSPDDQAVLVRHGETAWSRAGRHTSRTDIPLTYLGRLTAARLEGELGTYSFGRVLTSPLSRAVDTCRLADLAVPAETCDDLREWDYGDYEGRTTEEVRVSEPGWTIWTKPPPGGETIEQVAARADRVIALIRSADSDVAVFGHGHMLRVLGARWCGLEPEAGRLFALDPTSVSVLGYEREVPILLRWNQLCRQIDP